MRRQGLAPATLAGPACPGRAGVPWTGRRALDGPFLLLDDGTFVSDRLVTNVPRPGNQPLPEVRAVAVHRSSACLADALSPAHGGQPTGLSRHRVTAFTSWIIWAFRGRLSRLDRHCDRGEGGHVELRGAVTRTVSGG
jgi:hypothetical protein